MFASTRGRRRAEGRRAAGHALRGIDGGRRRSPRRSCPLVCDGLAMYGGLRRAVGGHGYDTPHGADLRRGVAPRLRHPARPGRGPLPAEGSVDATVETNDWSPIEGVDDLVDRIAFVDGVRRVDARLARRPGARSDPRHRRHVRRRSGRVAPDRAACRGHRRAYRALGGARRRQRGADAAGRARAGGRHDAHARRRSRAADDDPALEDARRRG